MKFHILILLVCLTYVSSVYREILVEPEGSIKETLIENDGRPLDVTYLIQAPSQTITTIRLIQLLYTNCKDAGKCCFKNFLEIGDQRNRSRFCGNTVSKWISIKGSDIEVRMHVERGKAELWMEYKIRNSTVCPQHEYQCMDGSDCYNSREICDNHFVCKDHSDDVGCPYCAQHLTPCDTWSSICFDPKLQRCDGVLDCPKGEDEVGCSKHCNATRIDCLTNYTCVLTDQICDGIINCPNAFDEMNCEKQFCKTPSYFLCNNGKCIDGSLVGNAKDDCGDFSDEMNLNQLIKICSITLTVLLLTVSFTGLVARWCATRRDIHRLLQNLPEFPLPPFQGPGDDEPQECYQLVYSNTDFRIGGDIYEAFVRSRRRMEDDRNKSGGGDERSTTTHSGSSTFNVPNEDEIEIIKALVSLSLPHSMCVGLEGYFVDLMRDDGFSIGETEMKSKKYKFLSNFNVGM